MQFGCENLLEKKGHDGRIIKGKDTSSTFTWDVYFFLAQGAQKSLEFYSKTDSTFLLWVIAFDLLDLKQS